MLLVRMLHDGYQATTRLGQRRFDVGSDHETLFQFLEADLSPIAEYLSIYFQSVVDSKTLAVVNGKSPKTSTLNKARKLVEAAHPFLKENDPDTVVAEMLAYHLNVAILFHKLENITREWYSERMQALLKPLLRMHARTAKVDLLGPIKPGFAYPDFEETCFQKYLDAALINAVAATAIRGLRRLTYLQRKFNLQIHWLLDASARYFSRLTLYQRARVFRDIFAFDTDHADLRITKRISLSNPDHERENPFSAKWDQMQELIQAVESGTSDTFLLKFDAEKEQTAYRAETRQLLAELRDNSVVLAPDLEADLSAAIQQAIQESEPAIYEEYEVETLDQLLFLELEQLIRNHTLVKKCRNCDRYFITDNMNVDYCDRLAPGEQVACSVIGSKRAFDKKLDQDMPLKLYNRAYKTHYARKMKGLMKKEEFESWRDEAKRKLNFVRLGGLNVDEYGKWLKK